MRGQWSDVGDVGSGTERPGLKIGTGQAAEPQGDDEEAFHVPSLPETSAIRQGAADGGNRDDAARIRNPLRSVGGGATDGGFARVDRRAFGLAHDPAFG